jgi:hypothetical protein
MKRHFALKAVLVAAGAFLLAAAVPASPGLPLTVAFIDAGGGAGAGSFSSVRAFGQTLGSAALQSELTKLRSTFGDRRVDRFIHALDYAFIDGWKIAGTDNVTMPSPSPDSGNALVIDMIKAGTSAGDNTFRVTAMLDSLLTARVHAQVASDLTTRYGGDAATNLEAVGNEFFYDVAHSLGEGVSIPTAPSLP